MSNLCDSYTKVLQLLHELDPMDNFLNHIRVPRLSDKQVIALAAEGPGLDSARYLFKQLPPCPAKSTVPCSTGGGAD